MEKTESLRPAYMITSGNIVDPERMAIYLENSIPLFIEAGAEEVAFGHEKANNILLLEGEWSFPGLVMAFRFPSMDAIRELWDNPEYQKWVKYRDDGVVDPNFTIAIEERDTLIKQPSTK
jgi:uncharacterized protein (DUF1330 family)